VDSGIRKSEPIEKESAAMSKNIAKPQPATKSPADQPSEYPVMVETERLLNRIKEVSEAIAKRAYDFFEQRGREFGRDVDDWLHAELELLRPAPVEIIEGDSELKVRVEVPGFTAKDIQVSVDPQRVIISGKLEKTDEQKTERTVYTERRSNEILRTLELPAEVDPTKATATLKDGVLHLSLAKAVVSEPVKVEVKAG
jgi:HSP20 family protein